MHDLLGYGVPFDRDLEGHLLLSREAAHSERRIVRVDGGRGRHQHGGSQREDTRDRDESLHGAPPGGADGATRSYGVPIRRARHARNGEIGRSERVARALAEVAFRIPRVTVDQQTGTFGGGLNDDLSKFGARSVLSAQVYWELRNLDCLLNQSRRIPS